MTLPLNPEQNANREFVTRISPSDDTGATVCDLRYLTELMGGKALLIRGIMDAFLKQAPDELLCLVTAIELNDYDAVRKYSHTMKSSVSIVGIRSLIPILQEMENLGTQAADMGKITELNNKLNAICKLAIAEIEIEKHKYENL